MSTAPYKRGDKVVCMTLWHADHEVLGAVRTVASCDQSRITGKWYIRLVELVDVSSCHNYDAARYRPAVATDYPAPGKEADPTGRSAHEPGAKLDSGKLRPALVLGGFANALLAVTKVGTDGANKYTDNGWKAVPNGLARYEDALHRHLLKHQSGEKVDPDSGSTHLAHVAWNALALIELTKEAE